MNNQITESEIPFTPTHHAEAENCDVAIVEPRQSLAGRANWLLCRNRFGAEWYIPESELTEINARKCGGCGDEIPEGEICFGVLSEGKQTQLCAKCWTFVSDV